ncbi:MAG: hypothetical protein ACYC8T_31140, partial [Myxococcaceae bacterium]
MKKTALVVLVISVVVVLLLIFASLGMRSAAPAQQAGAAYAYPVTALEESERGYAREEAPAAPPPSPSKRLMAKSPAAPSEGLGLL